MPRGLRSTGGPVKVIVNAALLIGLALAVIALELASVPHRLLAIALGGDQC